MTLTLGNLYTEMALSTLDFNDIIQNTKLSDL